MADASAKPGNICRALVSATPFANDDDASDCLTALSSMTRIDDILSDAKRTDSRATATLKERGRDYEGTFVGGRSLGFSAKITRRPGNSGYDILKTAYETKAEIAVALATGNTATAGTKVQFFVGIITKWDTDEPDPGASTHDCEIMVSGVSAFTPVEGTVA